MTNIGQNGNNITASIVLNFNAGTLTEDSWWEVSESIGGNVTLNSGKTLTVMPGTTASFASGAILIVNGNLQAVGTGTIIVRDNDISNSSANAGILVSSSTVQIYKNYIHNCQYGVRLQTGSSADIHDNDLYANEFGLFLEQSQSSNLKWNNFGYTAGSPSYNTAIGMIIYYLTSGNNFMAQKWNNFFEFDLPDFDKAAPEKINIVYAVLAFEVDVLATDAGALSMLEALISAPNKSSPQADLAYNTYPVTARIRRQKTGIELVEVDITQAIDQWVARGVANNGLLLVSRRNAAEKILRQGKIALGVNAIPAVTIFYALTDI
ncbi:MAG: right-handed parallel beta-helix repeat-containing protein [bacterium]